MANQLRQSLRRPEERKEIAVRDCCGGRDRCARQALARRSVSAEVAIQRGEFSEVRRSQSAATAPLPTCARSRAIIPLRASCFLSDSFPAASSRKRPRKACELHHLRLRGRRSRKLFYQVFAPISRRQPAFFPPAFADPNFPHP